MDKPSEQVAETELTVADREGAGSGLPARG